MGSTAPASLLERVVNERVVLQLKGGRSLQGRLLGCDEHLNLVLYEAEETTGSTVRRLGRVVVRGSNIVNLLAPSG